MATPFSRYSPILAVIASLSVSFTSSSSSSQFNYNYRFLYSTNSYRTWAAWELDGRPPFRGISITLEEISPLSGISTTLNPLSACTVFFFVFLFSLNSQARHVLFPSRSSIRIHCNWAHFPQESDSLFPVKKERNGDFKPSLLYMNSVYLMHK